MTPNHHGPTGFSSRDRIIVTVAGITLILALGLIVPFAGTGAYIAMVPSLILTAWAVVDRSWTRQADSTFPFLFISVFLLFGVFTVMPNRPAGSAIYIFDFLPFILAAGLYAALIKMPLHLLLKVIANGALLGTFLSILIGCYQILVLGDHRADGFGGSAIHYANISLLLGFLALAPLLVPRQWHWHYGLAPFLGIGAALMSGSRSMILVGGTLAVILVIHLWTLKGRGFQQRGLWALSAVAVSGIAIVSIFALSDARQVERIVRMFDQATALLQGNDMGDRSMAIRLNYYQAGVRAILDNPVFGYGWHQSANALSPYLHADQPSGAARHLHNDVLNFAVAFGVFGVAGYFLALAAPILTWWRGKDRRLGVASYLVFCVVSSYFAMGITNVNFYYEAPKVMFCFAAAAAAAISGRRTAA